MRDYGITLPYFIIYILIGVISLSIGVVSIIYATYFLIGVSLFWFVVVSSVEEQEQIEVVIKKNIYVFTLLIFLLASIFRIPSIVLLDFPLEKAAIFFLATSVLITLGFSGKKIGVSTENFVYQLVFGLALGLLFPSIYYLFVFLIGGFFGSWYMYFDVYIFVLWLPFYLSVGLGEEGLFRALIERLTIIASNNYKKGLIWASFLFGIWHVYWYITNFNILAMIAHVVFAFLFGLLLGIIYEKLNSLIVVATIHGLWDAFAASVIVLGFKITSAIAAVVVFYIVAFIIVFLLKRMWVPLLTEK